ncbi:MAG: hypothetical protein ABIJ81_02315 [Patescibacteria group bacterium]
MSPSQFVKFRFPASLGRAKIPSPQPPSFLPVRAKIIKSQRSDFVQDGQFFVQERQDHA